MAEQRLPVVDGDDGIWGEVLNQYISKEHYNSGADNSDNGGHQNITIRPGTTSAGTAPLKFTSGSLLSTPESGTIEYLSNRFYIRGLDGLSVEGGVGIGITPSGAKLHIQDAAAKLKMKDSNTPSLTLGLASEVGGQLIDYGANYSQLGDVNTSYAGGFFRIDLRDAYSSEFFNVKYIPAGGSETTIYQVSRTGDMATSGNLTVSGTGSSSIAGNLSTNNTLNGYTTTATAAGTTTLTATSKYQQYFTGSSTQTVQMPVTSTLVLGQQWRIVNKSTGLVTINSSGSNQICVLSNGANVTITCMSLSGTDASSWSVVVGSSMYVGTTAPSSPAINDVWIDTN